MNSFFIQTFLMDIFLDEQLTSTQSFPSPGALPDLGIEPRSPALQADSLLSEPSVKPLNSKKRITITYNHFQYYNNRDNSK